MIDTTQILGALQARLIADATITGLVPSSKIGNYIPQDTAYPHIQYECDFETFPIKGEDAHAVTIQFNIWTNYRGSKECMQITDAIRTEFDQAPLTIASGDCFGMFYQTMDHFQEPEGNLYRCSMVFQLLVGA
jgi:hypothetical protein